MSKKYTSLENIIRNVVVHQLDEAFHVKKHPVHGKVLAKDNQVQSFSYDKADDLAAKHKGSLIKTPGGKYIVKVPETLPHDSPLEEGIGVGGSDNFDNTPKAFLTRKYDSKVGGHSAAGKGAAANMKTSETMNSEEVASGTKEREKVEYVDRGNNPKSSKSVLGREASLKNIAEAMAQVQRNVNESRMKATTKRFQVKEDNNTTPKAQPKRPVSLTPDTAGDNYLSSPVKGPTPTTTDNTPANPAPTSAASSDTKPLTVKSDKQITINKGDTLSDLAARHNISVAAFLAKNSGIKDANKIKAGDTINIPDPSFSGQKTYQSGVGTKNITKTSSPPVQKGIQAAKKSSSDAIDKKWSVNEAIKNVVNKKKDERAIEGKGKTEVDIEPNLKRVSGSELAEKKKEIRENRLIRSFINFHKK